MWGIPIGVASGVLQYFLLLKFTTALSGGKLSTKTIVFAITQFLLPLAVLLLCAFFLGENILGENFLMWIGIGMAAALVTCAVVKFLLFSKAVKAGASKAKPAKMNNSKSSKPKSSNSKTSKPNPSNKKPSKPKSLKK